ILATQRLTGAVAHADAEAHFLLAFELMGEHTDRTGYPGRRIAAHDVAFDEQFLRFLRRRCVRESKNRRGQGDHRQCPGIRGLSGVHERALPHFGCCLGMVLERVSAKWNRYCQFSVSFPCVKPSEREPPWAITPQSDIE